MPQPSSTLHLASVDYQCTVGLLPPGGGPVQFQVPDPVHFTFGFETGTTPVSPGVVEVTWDYSWFNQAQVEAGITATLGQLVEAVAPLLPGLPLTDLQAAVNVTRVWTFAPNVQGAGVSSGRVVTMDQLPYPPVVSDADGCAAADGGEDIASG
jgi:hypothetical protein